MFSAIQTTQNSASLPNGLTGLLVGSDGVTDAQERERERELSFGCRRSSFLNLWRWTQESMVVTLRYGTPSKRLFCQLFLQKLSQTFISKFTFTF